MKVFKIVLVVLSLVLCFVVTSCKKDPTTPKDPNQNNNAYVDSNDLK